MPISVQIRCHCPVPDDVGGNAQREVLSRTAIEDGYDLAAGVQHGAAVHSGEGASGPRDLEAVDRRDRAKARRHRASRGVSCTFEAKSGRRA